LKILICRLCKIISIDKVFTRKGPKERYQLNWPGKKEAWLTANAPISKTLRPFREESVDFDTTEKIVVFTKYFVQ
jgi:hypothetical protein